MGSHEKKMHLVDMSSPSILFFKLNSWYHIVCLLEFKRLIMQELADTYDGALMVTKAYNNKKKGGKNNSKVKYYYCKQIGHIRYTSPKAKEDMKE